MTAKTPSQLAGTAADAVRALNHATLGPDRPGWEYPADAYDVIGGLDQLVGFLPQALDQIARHIERLAADGHIRSTKGGDGSDEVATALRALEWANADATQLQSRLATVHSALSPLAYKD
ncbi:hypothetical protein [Streptomyces bacillaris]|uniref:hypothetical protein n=1 Tax=Streptomyces bacillaris TaxID=68179 RepID=UPI00345F7286